MKSERLHGVIVPVITPIDTNEDVDAAAFKRVLHRLVDAGVNGIFVGGSAGEGPLLADAQWRRMVEIAHEEVRGRIPLLGGVMDTSTRRLCERVKVLRTIGYSHFVVTPTFYMAIRTPEEHLRLFGAAKEAAGDMEMIAYNIPGCVGSALAIDTLCDMVRRGWIRHCKESSGNWEYHAELLQRAPEAGLTVLAGDELISGRALLAGAKGIVPVCANYDPAAYIRLYQAGIQGNKAGVETAMQRALHLRRALVESCPCWLSGIKYAVSVLGIGSAQMVSPIEPSGPEARAMIDAMVKEDLAAGVVAKP